MTHLLSHFPGLPLLGRPRCQGPPEAATRTFASPALGQLANSVPFCAARACLAITATELIFCQEVMDDSAAEGSCLPFRHTNALPCHFLSVCRSWWPSCRTN